MAPVSDKASQLIIVKVTIAGFEVAALVDTGATTSCCRWGWYQKWKSHLGSLKKSSTMIVGVKAPLANSRINWVYDSPPRQSHLIAPRQTTSKSKTSIITQKSHDKKPRNNIENNNGNQANNAPKNNDRNNNNKQGHNSLAPKKKRNRYYRRERRAIERAERGEMFNHDTQWASQCPGDPSSPSVPMGMTHSGPQHGDPISAMRPAVYYPRESVGSSRTNENSPFQIGPDAGESPGLQSEQLGYRASLSYQDFRSEQLRFPDKDRDHLPPSATPTTS